MQQVVRWLLTSDPAVRWQVLRDLTDEPESALVAERARVAREGWGANLLALQSPSGPWGASDDEGWMTTIYSLLLLREFGVDPNSAEARRAVERVCEHVRWEQLDGRPFFEGETEPCLNGAILASGAYFGHASDALVQRLLDEQLPDGGWNCEAPASTRSSFHTTIGVLEGLLEYERARGPSAAVSAARSRAHAYLLDRRMFRSLRSGDVIDRRWLRFAFPTRWHYDVLRGLDYLRNAGVAPDERAAEAIDIVRARRHQNGRWPLNTLHADLLTMPLETGAGTASRWNTLRALRVLRWYAPAVGVGAM